ncbi:rRNA methylase [Pleurocapsa sp. PCC 7327]|uniref:TrmH family RNA methyltransferase n=1 Tax=Pleurocapsa sp. PCC 7327 TaxID=118163 RepID=UPI00029FF56B|nr:RNA methyltransferase [Pleurocapsa sp. PCC 7327]AFY77352.1 rRNA methylase [Pleurocapsa sp. PCC 7327]
MITSLQNPLVKQMRKLHSSKGRREQHLFLLEGTHLLETACESNCSLATVCCTEQWRDRYPQLWEKASKQAQRVEIVSPEVLGAITTTVHPDGVVATALRIIDRPAKLAHLKLGLVLERLQDPGNLGTIIRTAVAAGADGLWLSDDSVDVDNPKVLRSSAGAWFRLPIIISSNLTEIVADYRSRGVQIVATLPKAKKLYWEIDFTGPTLILLGNEGAGLTQELVSLSNLQIKIPLGEGVESLNVAIAAALLLYEAQRQRRIESYS